MSLSVRDLTVTYGTTLAVDRLSFSLAAGSSLAVLGPNGAGKTSLLRAMSRLVPDATGEVDWAGSSLVGESAWDVPRSGIVHVPEGRQVFADLTVDENLAIGRNALARRSPDFDLDDIFDLFPALVPLRRRLGYALSGGEQQMVALGRGLMASPRLLMVDEPSLGLAPAVVASVRDALRAIRGRTTLVMVEQNLDLAGAVCEEAMVLRGGQKVFSGATASLMDDRATTMAAYLGQ